MTTQTRTERRYQERIHYVRHYDRAPFGVIVVVYNPATEQVHVGWSLCHPVDRFSKSLGKRIAYGRLNDKDALKKLTDILYAVASSQRFGPQYWRVRNLYEWAQEYVCRMCEYNNIDAPSWAVKLSPARPPNSL